MKGIDCMRKKMREFFKKISPVVLWVIDLILFPVVFLCAFPLRLIRKLGLARMRASRAALLKAGVIPVIDHYYEPLFNEKHLRVALDKKRRLPGIDWNASGQLDFLSSMNYGGELSGLPDKRGGDLEFYFDNPSFKAGDCEYWYSLIRRLKPRTIIEIGSGHSTKIAIMAVNKNKIEDKNYECRHICIEPYEMPWLEKTPVTLIRRRVETAETDIFMQLKENDILFIDSSHIIRPQGDVLFEYLELLPVLNKGVIVHVHDIFSPRDYPASWLIDCILFWNEQYLLEAFLTSNKDYEIIGALNYLRHNHYGLLREKCPRLNPACEPGSFYIRKIK